MKMNVRKWLSAVLAVTMIVAAIPLGVTAATVKTAMTDTDSWVSNGDFECWKDNGKGKIEPVYWHGGAFGEGETYGKYARIYNMTSTETRSMYQTIAVDSGVTYKLTFQAKIVAGSSFTVSIIDENNVSSLKKACTGTAGQWTNFLYFFQYEGDLEQTTLRFTIEDASADVYIDNVLINRDLSGTESTDVSYDGYITDGDFESGTTNFWNITGGQIVEYNGSYALKATTTSRYSNVATQTIIVEENTDYTLSLKSLYVGSHTGAIARVHIYAGNSGSTELAKPSYYWNISVNTLDTHQLTFNSGSYTTVRIVIQQHAAPNSSSAMNGNIYYDEFVLRRTADIEEPTVSFDGYITDGDFESGTTDYWTVSGGQILSYNGSSVLKATTTNKYSTVAEQTVTVEANVDYVLDVTALYVGTDTNAQARVHVYAGSTTTDLVSTYYWNVNSNAVSAHQLTFNSANNTSVRICIQQAITSNGNIYYDDFVLARADGQAPPAVDDPDTPDTPENPDTPSVMDGYTYYYSNAAYSSMLNKTVTGETGKTYRISFSARAVTNGFRVYVNQRTESGANVYDYTDFWGEDTRSRTDISFICRSTLGQLEIKVVNLGNGTVETNLYITDFEVTEIPDTPVDIIQFKGMSAREQAPEPDNITAGLGFLFRVNMKNAVTVKESDGHIYQTNTATAYPFTNSFYANDPYPYTVVRVGAIMSLDPDAANAGLTLESTAEDRSTIDVVGRKRWTYNDTDMANGYSYAVRIVNIPERHFGTTIYARPYVIVQAGERTVTLYGQMQQGTYKSFFGTEA